MINLFSSTLLLIIKIKVAENADQDEPAVPVRQLLTARKGQRPTAWVDFSEARETVLGWVGYKMMSVTRQTAGGDVSLGDLRRSCQVPPTVEDVEAYFVNL
tara:strand:+ start:246 stop:548 length:303 start_codon:yes stop_codon:yes gene_type:complete